MERRKQADPAHFPDLSLAVVKLLGAGEYTLVLPGQDDASHFGLAAQDYTHATAPNRRYADLVTQRLLKATVGAIARAVYERRACGDRRADATSATGPRKKLSAACVRPPLSR